MTPKIIKRKLFKSGLNGIAIFIDGYRHKINNGNAVYVFTFYRNKAFNICGLGRLSTNSSTTAVSVSIYMMTSGRKES